MRFQRKILGIWFNWRWKVPLKVLETPVKKGNTWTYPVELASSKYRIK